MVERDKGHSKIAPWDFKRKQQRQYSATPFHLIRILKYSSALWQAHLCQALQDLDPKTDFWKLILQMHFLCNLVDKLVIWQLNLQKWKGSRKINYLNADLLFSQWGICRLQHIIKVASFAILQDLVEIVLIFKAVVKHHQAWMPAHKLALESSTLAL